MSTETRIEPGDRVRNAHEVEGIVVSVSDASERIRAAVKDAGGEK